MYIQATSDLSTIWDEMSLEKGDLVTRSENYARLSCPYICPPVGTERSEQEKGDVIEGSRLVNHLANKVVNTMFPHDTPFFAVALSPEARQRLRKEMGEDKEAQFSEAVRTETANIEDLATRKLNLVAYRPVAVEAVKHQIITGNVVIVRTPSGRRVNYGIKDFGVRRRIDGTPYQLMLRDNKKFATLDEGMKSQLKQARPDYKDTDDCVLLTLYTLRQDMRWATRQAVENIQLPPGTLYTEIDFPCIVLAWNLARGENYGRGLVEDNIVAFHNIDVFTKALVDIVGVVADIKFLVDPASTLDPAELNASVRGSYHQGRKDDITTPDAAKNLPLAEIIQVISIWERNLSQAFLFNTNGIRDAERVTAEEIRVIANELESAFGGLYSRLALEWQRREAEYAVDQLKFDKEMGSGFSVFEIIITTGLESLSREGQLENVRRAMADLAIMNELPEDLRAAINPMKFAAFVFTNHTVRYKEFLFTADEMQANREAQLAQAGHLEDMKANSTAKAEAAKKVVQES